MDSYEVVLRPAAQRDLRKIAKPVGQVGNLSYNH
jgi:hypothetical protein